MYTPQKFKNTDHDEAMSLMTNYPFATVISVNDNTPSISHLPLTAVKFGQKIQLIGHLAKANPHWKVLQKNKTTAIFHGPHTYITPKWYAENDVPTWNYATVHVNGSVELIEDTQGLIDCLKILTAHAEKIWPSGWEFFIPDDLSGESLKRSIVGFKISVEELTFKMKMSQNRSSEDLEGIFTGLQKRNDDQSQLVLAMMQKLFASGHGQNG